MISPKTKKLFFLAAAAGFAAAVPALADEVKCRDGTVIVGTVESIDGGIVTVANESDDAGKTKIKQSEVVSISTDKSVFVRTPDKNTLFGKIVPAEDKGKVKVDGGSVLGEFAIADLSGSWPEGVKSPEEKAIEDGKSKWSYSLALSLLGKTGNTESIALGVSAEAIRKSSEDELKFYVDYNYGKTKDDSDDDDDDDDSWTKSADDLHCGVDYTYDITERFFWYAREDMGFDRVKNIRFLSTSAAGVGYRFIKEDNWNLSVRVGLSYRYETYRNYMDDDDWDDPDDTSAVGMDFGLHHDYKWSWGSINTDITYTPTFEDFFNDYVFEHETYVDFKVDGVDNMDVRIGVKNEYRGETSSHDHLDTTYYAKIVFAWP